jgi:hypothetical protein
MSDDPLGARIARAARLRAARAARVTGKRLDDAGKHQIRAMRNRQGESPVRHRVERAVVPFVVQGMLGAGRRLRQVGESAKPGAAAPYGAGDREPPATDGAAADDRAETSVSEAKKAKESARRAKAKLAALQARLAEVEAGVRGTEGVSGKLVPFEVRAREMEDRLAGEVRRVAGSSERVIAGPFLGEVGFELLYWIPFLRCARLPSYASDSWWCRAAGRKRGTTGSAPPTRTCSPSMRPRS